MNRVLIARIVLTLAGVGVWGYGARYNLPDTRIAGIAILVVSFLLRFAPKSWKGEASA